MVWTRKQNMARGDKLKSDTVQKRQSKTVLLYASDMK